MVGAKVRPRNLKDIEVLRNRHITNETYDYVGPDTVRLKSHHTRDSKRRVDNRTQPRHRMTPHTNADEPGLGARYFQVALRVPPTPSLGTGVHGFPNT